MKYYTPLTGNKVKAKKGDKLFYVTSDSEGFEVRMPVTVISWGKKQATVKFTDYPLTDGEKYRLVDGYSICHDYSGAYFYNEQH